MAIAKKKKRFFDVEIPLVNRETQLIALEPSELDGKFIKYDLTRVLKGKGTFLDLQVKKQDEKLTTIPQEITIVPYYIKRMVRKGTDYVEDSFEIECKNARLRIKPILVTRRKVSKAVRRALRKKAKEEIEKSFKIKDFESIFEDLLRNRIQKEFSLKMKKIYPLSLFDIRNIKVLEITGPLEPKKAREKEEKLDQKISEDIKVASQTKSKPAKEEKTKSVKKEAEEIVEKKENSE
jgi:ribosomal protein S3AE